MKKSENVQFDEFLHMYIYTHETITTIKIANMYTAP